MAKEETTIEENTNSDDGPWYGKYGLTEEGHINVVKQYKTENDFVLGAIETKKKIGAMFSVPDPNDADYADKLKASRVKLGGKTSADDYTSDIPDELTSFATDEFIQSAKESAAKWGLTQSELDEGLKSQLEATKQASESNAAQNKEQTDKAANLKVANREALEKLWGARTDDQLARGMDVARHFDTTLFAQDNLSISEEERAEKGGLLAQRLKAADDPILHRLFAIMHDKFLSEGDPTDHHSSTKSSLYNERFAQAKDAYPNRPDWWAELAEGRSAI